MFFVETDSMHSGECLEKTKQESIDITVANGWTTIKDREFQTASNDHSAPLY